MRLRAKTEKPIHFQFTFNLNILTRIQLRTIQFIPQLKLLSISSLLGREFHPVDAIKNGARLRNLLIPYASSFISVACRLFAALPVRLINASFTHKCKQLASTCHAPSASAGELPTELGSCICIWPEPETMHALPRPPAPRAYSPTRLGSVCSVCSVSVLLCGNAKCKCKWHAIMCNNSSSNNSNKGAKTERRWSRAACRVQRVRSPRVFC